MFDDYTIAYNVRDAFIQALGKKDNDDYFVIGVIVCLKYVNFKNNGINDVDEICSCIANELYELDPSYFASIKDCVLRVIKSVLVNLNEV